MIVQPVKTAKILPNQKSLFEVLDDSIPKLNEKSIVVITSKIVSLCEGRVVVVEGTDKNELIKQEADYYLPNNLSKFGHHFTIKGHTIIGAAGIDASNSAGFYVLWPADPQKSANQIRRYLKKDHSLRQVGVIITDSISIPMRRGSVGAAIAYSGFKALNDYRGRKDLFDRELQLSVSNIAEGLAATAVVAMGEGDEQTPIAVIEDVFFVKFQDRNPTKNELEDFYVNWQGDLFEPFLSNANWQKGGHP